MKNVWKLSNYFFSWMMKKGGKVIFGCSIGLGICGFLAQAFPTVATKDSEHHFPKAFFPYEAIVDTWIPIIFLLGLLGLLVMLFWQAKSFYINHKGIYTLLTLPMKRERIYFSFLLSGMAVILLYFMVWLLLILAAYFPIMAQYNRIAAKEIFYVSPEITVKGLDAARTNGLYLAFQRSAFLYTAFPLNLVRALSLVSGLFLILVGILYAGLHYAEPFLAGIMAFGSCFLGGQTILLALLERWQRDSIVAATQTGSGIAMNTICILAAIGVVWLSVRDIRKKYTL